MKNSMSLALSLLLVIASTACLCAQPVVAAEMGHAGQGSAHHQPETPGHGKHHEKQASVVECAEENCLGDCSDLIGLSSDKPISLPKLQDKDLAPDLFDSDQMGNALSIALNARETSTSMRGPPVDQYAYRHQTPVYRHDLALE